MVLQCSDSQFEVHPDLFRHQKSKEIFLVTGTVCRTGSQPDTDTNTLREDQDHVVDMGETIKVICEGNTIRL